MVLDARHLSIPNYRLAIRTDQPPVVAESGAALAGKLGVPAATREATVARFNAACVPGEWKPLVADGVHTEGLTPPKSNWAMPLEQGPFHAYPIMSANVFTFGGVKVDGQARVLDHDGNAIPGLYAAGEVIGLFWGT